MNTPTERKELVHNQNDEARVVPAQQMQGERHSSTSIAQQREQQQQQ